jgi:transposase
LGKTSKITKPLVRGERISVLAFLSVHGIIDCKIFKGTMNTDLYCDFLEKALLPHLMPFDGKNPHSVVVLDNLVIHHAGPAIRMIQEVGTLAHFLLPYFPDYNPIEEAFSKVKAEMMDMEKEAQATDDLESLVLAAFAVITPDNCRKWIQHAGIYTD